LEEANSRFIIAWEKQGVGASPLDARSFDVTFQNYAKANGFYDGLYYGLGSLTKPIGAVTSVVSGASAGIATIGSLTKYLLPIAGLALAYFAFMAYAPRRRK
jgi:threonine/homoserine/homoserine lactone efflux protein